MKKTISIHLMGTNFLVEEDAYELVRNYLDRLKNSLRNSNDQQEICEDVELRIAELATQHLADTKKQVVSLEEMQRILATLGQPEEFVEDGDPFETEEPVTGTRSTFRERRFFRDTENGAIAGVCAGLAAYFRVDVVIIRILFILLGFAGGFVIPIYIIIWLVMPEARTNIDRLQMQGRPINLETLREEFEGATQRFSRTSRGFEREMRDKNSPTRQRLDFIGSALSKIIGLGFLIFGSISMVTLFIFSFMDIELFPFSSSERALNFNQLSELILVGDSNAFYLWLGGFIAGLSIVLFMLLMGAALLFRLRSKWIKRTFMILSVTAAVGIFTAVYQGIKTGSDFTISGEYEQKVGQLSDSLLQVKILPSIRPNFVSSEHDFDFDGRLFEIQNGNVIQSGIEITYALSEDTNFYVYAEYSAQGRTERKAINRGRHISHEISMAGNQLNIAPYYRYPKTDKVRNQSVRLTIRIPAGKTIHFKNYIVTSDNVKDTGYIDEEGNYEHYTY